MLPAMASAVLVLITALQLLLTREIELPDAGWSRGNGSVTMPSLSGRFVPTALREQPIFDPRRTAQAKTASAVADLPLGGAVVAGVVTIKGRSYAIIQPPQGSAVNLPVGSRFRGWQLRSISSDGAQFVKGGAPIRIALGGTPTLSQPESLGEEEEQQ